MPVLRDAAIFRWLYPMDSRFRGNDGGSAGMTVGVRESPMRVATPTASNENGFTLTLALSLRLDFVQSGSVAQGVEHPMVEVPWDFHHVEFV